MQAATDFSLIQKAQEGVSIEVFDQLLQDSGLSKNELSQILGIDPRTIDNYRKSTKPFDTLKGELLLKLKELFTLGEEVFGSSEDFKAWLHLPAGEFNNTLPLFLLATSTGVDLVAEQLERIAQGYVV
ncbi:antitoxin Xre-like helix-turn-helix domain-containing protein [Catalinimonas sp. 4WD22]|uniref:type II RES/Xre toxin-antitoxin system antitoxin n=1 Tax=Catalinimonas locisalis TaxID=3133978 RepID=UPI0031015B62